MIARICDVCHRRAVEDVLLYCEHLSGFPEYVGLRVDTKKDLCVECRQKVLVALKAWLMELV